MGLTLDENLPHAYHKFTNKGKAFCEYHVDYHKDLWEYVREKEMGGDLSVSRNKKKQPVILIGQDECSFSQFSFASKAWKGPGGSSVIIPKGEGQTRMVSAYVARPFGLEVHVIEKQLKEINKRRKNMNYVSHDSE